MTPTAKRPTVGHLELASSHFHAPTTDSENRPARRVRHLNFSTRAASLAAQSGHSEYVLEPFSRRSIDLFKACVLLAAVIVRQQGTAVAHAKVIEGQGHFSYKRHATPVASSTHPPIPEPTLTALVGHIEEARNASDNNRSGSLSEALR